MANSIRVSGNASVTSDGLTVNNTITYTINMTGSNVTATVTDVALGSWQALNTSSLSDIRIFVASNVPPVDGQSGSIQIASAASGTPVVTILGSGDSVVLPWSGSLGLWARAYTSASALQYIVAES
jgi:hypothetical protein